MMNEENGMMNEETGTMNERNEPMIEENDVLNKRFDQKAFHMGFGKRVDPRSFHMGFGKRDLEVLDPVLEPTTDDGDEFPDEFQVAD